jgi:protein gp37
MNRTKIDWCDFSWNPIVGCRNGCSWCYASRQAKRMKHRCMDCYNFKPHIHPERLGQPLKVKKPSLIFADSMGDFWDAGVEQGWRDAVYDAMEFTPQHTYFLLTKQPQNIKDGKKIPKNCFVGVSITCFDDRWRVAKLITNTGKKVKHFLSLEPLLDDNVSEYIYLVDWVIVGCLTGVKKGFKPKTETITEIVNNCKRLEIPLFIKNNCDYRKKIQQYPKGEKRC